MHMASSRKRDPPRKLKIGFVLARSFTLSALALFVDTLRLSSDRDDRSGRVHADWAVIGSTRHLIRSSCGIQIAPTCDFTDPQGYSYIVVVGGLLSDELPIDDETKRFLNRADAAAVPLIGLCTGSFVLAEIGLMKDHVNCVSWLHFSEFRERFPSLAVRSDRLYNFDGKRGSCAGGSSSADMAASIIRVHLGRDAERNALEVLQIDKARLATDAQARRPLLIDCDDRRIQATLILMEQTLTDSISIAELASGVNLSRRQLERLFKEKVGLSPSRAYLTIRMQRARTLLVQSNASILEIALEVGLENASHFSSGFRRVYGISPSKVRKVGA